MINGHETHWGRLGFIAMHEVKAVMTALLVGMLPD